MLKKTKAISENKKGMEDERKEKEIGKGANTEGKVG